MPKLDLAKVKAKGYTDQQIQDYLSKRPDVEVYDSSAQPVKEDKDFKDLLVDNASLIGAVGGGLIGGPVGAVVGGTGGAVLREALDEEEGINEGRLATEAVLSGIGGGVAKGVSKVGAKVIGKTAPKAAGVVDEVVNLESNLNQGTRKIKLPPSVFGASQEKAVNKTLDKYPKYFSGGSQKQYEGLEPAMADVESQIQAFIVKNPTLSVARKDIEGNFMKSLGSSLRTKDLTSKQAQKEIKNYLDDLWKNSGGGNTDNISLGQLREMKKLVNTDYGRIADKIDKGLPLTSTEKVAASAWDSLDDAVKGVSPEVKELLTDESNFYKAARSLSSARSNPPTFRFMGTSVPAFATQMGRDVAGKAATTATNVVGKGVGALPAITTTGNLANQTLSQAGVRALVPEEMQDEQSQTNDQNYNDQSSQGLPPITASVTPQETENQLAGVPTQNDFINAYTRAMQAGDTKAAEQISEYYQDYYGDKGFMAGGKKVKKTESAIARDEMSFLVDDLLSDLSSKSIKTGPIAPKIEGIKSIVNAGDPDTITFYKNVAALKGAIAKARAGTSFTPNEQALLEQYAPSEGDSLQQIQAKLVQLQRRIQAMEGVESSGTGELPAITTSY